MTPQETVEQLCTIYGSTNDAAEDVGISRVTISRIRAGKIVPNKTLTNHLTHKLNEIERMTK